MKDPVNTENLFDEQGNLRCAFVAQIFENWMEETNFYSQINFGADCSVKKVVYVDAKNGSVKFGGLVDVVGQKGFQSFNAKSSLATQLTNGTLKTKDDLLNCLNDTKNPITLDVYTKIDYSNLDADYAENKATLDGLTKSVFNELSSEISGLDAKNVLFAYKTPQSKQGESDFGYAVDWNQAFLVTISGQLQLLEVSITSSTSFNTPLDNVINNTEYWRINSNKLTQLDNSNKALYDTVATTSLEYGLTK